MTEEQQVEYYYQVLQYRWNDSQDYLTLLRKSNMSEEQVVKKMLKMYSEFILN